MNRVTSNGMEIRRSQKAMTAEPLRVVTIPRVSTLDYLPRDSWWTRTDKPFAELRAAEQARMERSPLGKNTTLSYEAYIPDRKRSPVDAREFVPPAPIYPRAV